MERLAYIIIFFIVHGTKVLAQADICMTTHWYNRANYNPAFIARTDYLYIFSNARNQWVGVEGAPKVFNLQASGNFHSMRSAFGISLVGDKIGATQALNPMLTYAFRITNEQDWSLSMGLSGGVFTRSVDGSLFEAETTIDPSINYDIKKTVKPDANVGFEFQNASFIFGLSSTHLLAFGKPDDLFLNTNHRYGYGIYKNNNLDLFFYKVGILVVNRYNLTELEGNFFIRFKHPTGLIKGPRELFDLGLSYRSSQQLSFCIGLLVTPNLRVGYSYDHSFIPGYHLNETHEVLLEYRIPFKPASTNIRCGDEEFRFR